MLTDTELKNIDALIAIHVIGKKPNSDGLFDYSIEQNSKGYHSDPNPYSSDIAAAWEVVEKLVDNGLRLDIMIAPFGQFCVWVDGSELVGNYLAEEIIAESMPLAICSAALKAKGVNIDHAAENRAAHRD